MCFPYADTICLRLVQNDALSKHSLLFPSALEESYKRPAPISSFLCTFSLNHSNTSKLRIILYFSPPSPRFINRKTTYPFLSSTAFLPVYPPYPQGLTNLSSSNVGLQAQRNRPAKFSFLITNMTNYETGALISTTLAVSRSHAFWNFFLFLLTAVYGSANPWVNTSCAASTNFELFWGNVMMIESLPKEKKKIVRMHFSLIDLMPFTWAVIFSP